MRTLKIEHIQLNNVQQTIVYIGDVHGMYDALKHLINLIHTKYPDALIVFSGDLIDIGYNSREVINLVRSLITAQPHKYRLLWANHESHLCGTADNRENHTDEVVERWWNKGCGWSTLLCYGWKPPANKDFTEFKGNCIRNLVRAHVPRDDINFIKKYSVDALFINERIFLLHGSAVKQEIEENNLLETFKEPSREPFLTDRERFNTHKGKPVLTIHAHSPRYLHEVGNMKNGQYIVRDKNGTPRRVNVDGGASTGRSGKTVGAGILNAFCFALGDHNLDNFDMLSISVEDESCRPYENKKAV